MDELNAASVSLRAALDRYSAASISLRNGYAQANIVKSVPPELINSVDKQFLLASSYESKIEDAIAAIGVARNCSSTLVPITSLSTDVLTRIFLLASPEGCSARGRSSGPRSARLEFSTYSVCLSHVCSRWRQIVIGTPLLWSHIDISTSQSLNQRLLPRAQVFAARTGRALLDIHIVELNQFGKSCADAIGDLVEFLTPIAARIGSFSLELNGFFEPDTQKLCSSIFTTCFRGCVPGNLTRLELYRGMGGNYFIESAESEVGNPALRLDLSNQALEDLWRPVTVMHLRGFQPHWTSQAFRGLTDLRLYTGARGSISVPDLVGILTASPGLRIFDFSLFITDPDFGGALGGQVRLENLELLITRGLSPSDIDAFLHLITPGSGPLEVVIMYPFERDPPMEPEFVPDRDTLASFYVTQFFARSNVSKLCVVGLDGFQEVIELPSIAPRVQTVVLDKFEDSGRKELGEAATNVTLNSLCLRRSTHIRSRELRKFVDRLQVQSLTLHGCKFYNLQYTGTFDQQELQVELTTLCPIVKLIPGSERVPSDDWDYLD